MHLTNLVSKLTNKKKNYLEICLPFTTKKFVSNQSIKILDDLFYSLLDKYKINTLIECGANEATASLIAVKKGLKAIAIEANPFTFNDITPKNIKNLTTINVGLGELEDNTIFYSPKNNKTAGSSTFVPRLNEEYDEINVNIKPLDNILNNLDVAYKPFSLWIDVEGYQEQVLKGSTQTLNNDNCKFLKIEVENIKIFTHQKWLSNDVDKYLSKFNFIPVFCDFEFDNQFNVLYVKKNDLKISEKLINTNQINFLNKHLTFNLALKILFYKNNFLRELKAIVGKVIGMSAANKISKFLKRN